MTEIYRKRGRSVRREGRYLVWADEAGEAFDEQAIFRTRTMDEAVDLPAPDAAAVVAAAREIEACIEPPLTIERMLVSDGIVAHQFGEVAWSESPRRVHLSIARAPLRILFDFADFHLDVVRRAADLLNRAGAERKPPERIRLADHVGAALVPFASVEKVQTAMGRDGRGQLIEERRWTPEAPPNWFRPSYRVRPRKAWFHLRLESLGQIDASVPEAIALLAPASRREIRVLCADGRDVYPTTIPIRPIIAVRPAGTWYPYGAGTFGAEVML